MNPSRDHLAGWALYNESDTRDAPALEFFKSLEADQRRTVRTLLDRALAATDERGWLGLHDSRLTVTAWGKGHTPVHKPFRLEARIGTDVFSLYVAPINDRPVLLHISAMHGDNGVYKETNVAIARLANASEKSEIFDAFESLSDRSARLALRASNQPIALEQKEETRPQELAGIPWTSVEELVAAKQELAMALEYLYAERTQVVAAKVEEILKTPKFHGEKQRHRNARAKEITGQPLDRPVVMPAFGREPLLEVAQTKAAEVRKLGDRLGKQILGHPDLPPAIADAIGRGVGQKKGVGPRVRNLMAAEIYSAHLLEGIPLDGPAFGEEKSLPANALPIYTERVTAVVEMQKSWGASQVGAGLDGSSDAVAEAIREARTTAPLLSDDRSIEQVKTYGIGVLD